MFEPGANLAWKPPIPRQAYVRSGINFDNLSVGTWRIGARYHMEEKMRLMSVTIFGFSSTFMLADRLRLGGNSTDVRGVHVKI